LKESPIRTLVNLQGDLIARTRSAAPYDALPLPHTVAVATSSIASPSDSLVLYLAAPTTMSFVKESHGGTVPPSLGRSNIAPIRPQFNSHRTCDRLREGTGLQPKSFSMASKLRKGRKSVFKEIGLDDDFSDEGSPTSPLPSREYPRSGSISNEKDLEMDLRASHDDGHNTSKDEDRVSEPDEQDRLQEQRPEMQSSRPWYSKLSPANRRPRIKTASSAPPPTVSSLQRFALIALLIAVVFPAFSYNNGRQTTQINGADAGVIGRRDMSPVDVCTRWSQQGRCQALDSRFDTTC
jgi:hypothetical protein